MHSFFTQLTLKDCVIYCVISFSLN